MLSIQIVFLVALYMLMFNFSHFKSTKQNIDKKKIRPAWVVYPDVYKAEWLNQVIKKLWPFLQEHLRIVLKDLAKDISETYLKSYGTELKINLLKIGERPIQVVGAKAHHVNERTKVMIDFHLEYFSDADVEIILTLFWLKVKWPLKLKSLEVKGKLRVEVNVMTANGLPAINKLTISMLTLPSIDFDFGEFYEKLGIHILGKYLIGNWIEENLLYPLNMEVFDDTQGLEDHMILPQGVLNLILIEAKNLLDKDRYSFSSDVSDPYAVISFHVKTKDANSPQIFRFQTQTIENSLNVKWNYLCQVPMDNIENISDIKISVFDSDLVTADDNLGECEISRLSVVRTARTCKETQFWKKLYLGENSCGKVKLTISWSSLDVNNVITNNSQGEV